MTRKARVNSALKNEILPFATWLKLEGMKLSEISQTKKEKYHMISIIHRI